MRAMALGIPPQPPPSLPGREPDLKFGDVDVLRYDALARAGIHLRVFKDGEDVTRLCRRFSDRSGQAELYVPGPGGHATMAWYTADVAIRQVDDPLMDYP